MAKYTVDEFIIELGFNEKVIKGLQRVERSAMAAATKIETRLNRAVTIDGNRSKAGFDRIVRNANTAANNVNRAFNKSMEFGNAGKNSVRTVESAAKASAKRIKREMQDALNVRGSAGRRGPNGGGPNPPRGGGPGNGSGNGAARSIDRTYANNYYSGLTRKLESMGVRGRGLAGQFRANLTGLRDEALRNPAANLANYNMQVKASIDSMKRWISAENAETKARKEQAWLLNRANSSMTQWIGGFASLYTVIAGIRKMVDEGVKRQSADIAAKSIFGDKTADAKMTAATFGQQIGMSYSQTLKGFTDFSAGAAPSMGYDTSKEFYKNFNVFARLRGMNNEEQKGAMKAFTQMASKGVLSADEVKNQLPEHVAGGEQLLADAIGISVPELNKIMSTGKLMSKDVLPKLSDHLAKLNEEAGGLSKVSGMAVTNIGRINAALENDFVKSFKGAEGGLGLFTKAVAGVLTDSSAISEALGGVFGEVLTVAADGISHVQYWARMTSVALLRMSAWYMDLDEGQKKLIKGAAEFAIAAGEVLVVIQTLKGLTGLISALLSIKGVAGGAAGAGGAGGAGAGAAGGGIVGKILGYVKGAPKVIGPVSWALLAKAGLDATGVEQDYPDALGTGNPLAQLMNYLTKPSEALGATDKDSLTNSPFTRAMSSLGEWLSSNNALTQQNPQSPQNMFAVPSMYNPSVQNNQTMSINVNIDGQKLAEYNANIVTHNNEDVHINTEHMGD